MEWRVTYGIPQRRGGWLITEQRIIAADDYSQAARLACFHAMRGEQVNAVEECRH